jgi:hypothetical protein
MLPLELLLVSEQIVSVPRQLRNPLSRHLIYSNARAPKTIGACYTTTGARNQFSTLPLSHVSTAEIIEGNAHQLYDELSIHYSSLHKNFPLAHEAPWLQVEPETSNFLPPLQAQHDGSTNPSLIPSVMSHTRWNWRDRLSSKLQPAHRSQPDSPASVRSHRYPIRVRPNRSRLSPTDLLFSEVSAYETRFSPLLAAEEEEEESTLRERLSGWGLERLREEGYAMTGGLHSSSCLDERMLIGHI